MNPESLAKLDLAKLSIDEAIALDNVTPPPPGIVVNQGDNLQSMMDGAAPDTVFRIKPNFACGDIVCRKSVTLEHYDFNQLPNALISETAGLPTINGQIFTDAPTILNGIGIEGDPARPHITLIVNQGAGNVLLNRTRARGSANGQRRGMWLAAPNLVMLRSSITNIFYANETQALLTERDANGVVAEDCLFQASSMPVLVGGGDCWEPWRIPRAMRFTRCEFSRPPEWQNGDRAHRLWKNCFEVKNGVDIQVRQSVLKYNSAAGQTGHLLSLGVRNQYGRDPWSIVEDIVFEDNLCEHTSGAIAILGRDYSYPSDVMRRILLKNNQFKDVSAQTWGGNGVVLAIQGGPQDLTIDGLTVEKGAGSLNSLITFTNPTHKGVRFVARNWDVPEGTYSIQHDGTGASTLRGAAVLQEFMPGYTWENITIRRTGTPGAPVAYPAGTTLITA